jgi:tetratricopeptide (TPR) repeat protein
MTESSAITLKPNALAPTPGFSWRRKLSSLGFLSLLLVLSTLSVFLPVCWHDFVNYDDPDYVTSNATVQSGLNWANVTWAFTTGHASNWHPLTWLSHMLDCQLFGQRSGFHHLVNAFFHAINSWLLFLILRILTGALWRSLLVAALFALHPLHVESVAWISERKDVLSTLFFILAIGAYAWYVQATSIGRRSRTFVTYALALFFFACGLMSKPMLVTLPFVLLLLDYWPLNRLCLSGFSIGSMAPGLAINPTTKILPRLVPTLMRLIIEKIPFFALSLLSSYITFLVQRKGGAVSTSISLSARIANALLSYCRYIGKMFWPQNLSVLYPHPGHWPAREVAASGVLLVLILVAVILFGRKRPYLAVGWLWFFGTLIPVIGLVQVGVQSMADRYTYVPLIGLFIILVWGCGDFLLARLSVEQTSRSSPLRSKAALSTKPQAPSSSAPSRDDHFLPWSSQITAWGFGAGFLLLCCALLTLRQVQYWHNSETLFAHAVQVTKDNYLAYNNLGFYQSGLGKTAEAMENYRQSLKINPQYEDALNNLGYAFANQKKYTEAIQFYEAALRVRPKQTEVHNNLGNALSEIGRLDDAISQYRFVLEQKPTHADAHNNLGIALAMQGKLDEAIDHFHAAIRAKPSYASAHGNLGNALAAQRKFDQATMEYLEALRLQPNDPQSHNNLGNVLLEQGRLTEAVAHYEQALRLKSDNPEAHFNLGFALARLGRRQEAANHYTEALKLKPDYTEASRQLKALSEPASKSQ